MKKGLFVILFSCLILQAEVSQTPPQISEQEQPLDFGNLEIPTIQENLKEIPQDKTTIQEIEITSKEVNNTQTKEEINVPKLQNLPSQNLEILPQNSIPQNPPLDFQNSLTSDSPNLDTSSNLPSSKVIYIEKTELPDKILYVNQVIPYTIRLLVLSQYTTIQTEFVPNNSIEVLNPQETWTLSGEGMQEGVLEATFYLKIKQVNYTIPEVKITANTSEGVKSIQIDKKSDKAILLDRKGQFSQVIAQEFRILDSKITSFDSEHNLAVFQFESVLGNLFDFSLANYSQQGIESKSGDYKKAIAFYYVIIPKNLPVFSFEYFNTQQSRYVEIEVENVSQDNRVSTQSDIKPKNNFQIYNILLILLLAIVFIGLFFYKRKLIFIVLGGFFLLVLFYLLSVKTSATLKENTQVRIQPTFNSTVILVTQEPVKVEILTHTRGYYKIMFEDEKIGWVKENDVQD
ncbi:MAG: SH3 domain-containing protein [Helicobacter sp.]|nr:SH3 domain-containing protein [Helicobacter sp.]